MLRRFITFFLLLVVVAPIPLQSKDDSTMDNINVVGSDKNYPFVYINNLGVAGGFAVELLDVIMSDNQYNHSITILDRSQLPSLLEEGKSDILLGKIVTLPESSADNIIPILELDYAIICFGDNDIRDISDLQDKKVVITAQNYLEQIMFDYCKNSDVTLSKTIDDAMKLISDGDYDALICSHDQAGEYLSKIKLTNQTVSKTILQPLIFSFEVLNNNKYLVKIISNGLDNIKGNGEYAKVYDKWFVHLDKAHSPKYNYNLFIIILSIVLLVSIISILLLHRNIRRASLKFDSMSNDLAIAIKGGGVSIWKYSVEEDIFMGVIGVNYFKDRVSLSQVEHIIHPEERKKFQTDMAQLISGQVDNFGAITRMLSNQSNEYRYIETFISVVKEDNKPVMLIGTGKDVTKESLDRINLKEASQKQKTFLNITSTGLIYFGNNGKIKDINEAALSILGMEGQENLLREEVNLFSNPIIKDNFLPEHFAVPFAKLYEVDFNERELATSLKSTNIGTHNISVKFSPYINSAGGVDGVVVSFMDITETMSLNRELKRSNQLMTEVIDNLPCALFIKDSKDDFRYIISNPVFASWVGKSNEQVVGKTEYELFDKELADKFRGDDERVMSSGKPITVKEDTLLFGKRVIWRTTKMVINTVAGDKLLVGIAVDITQLENMNADLMIAKSRAEQSNKLKSAFVANISHEIRTPLNSIIGFSRLLETSTDKEEIAGYNKIIATSSDQLLQLINDVLDISSIESGFIDFHNVELDIHSFLTDLTPTFKGMINSEHVDFILDLPSHTHSLFFDPSRVTQILNNFILDASKNTTRGFIKLGYLEEGKGLKFYVQDTGTGIPDDKKAIIFNRFEKVNDFSQGMGLGLAICKSIIDARNGQIGFESKEGEGSTFWFWIPY